MEAQISLQIQLFVCRKTWSFIYNNLFLKLKVLFVMLRGQTQLISLILPGQVNPSWCYKNKNIKLINDPLRLNNQLVQNIYKKAYETIFVLISCILSILVELDVLWFRHYFLHTIIIDDYSYLIKFKEYMVLLLCNDLISKSVFKTGFSTFTRLEWIIAPLIYIW